MRILIADHDRGQVHTLSNRLTAEGYEVLQAVDGAETVSTVRNQHPDLVLLNTTFPPDVSHGGGAFTDAFLIMAWLQRMEEAAGIRIILMSDEDTPDLQRRAKAAGAMGFFPKPVNQEALLGVLQRMFGGIQQEAPSEATET